MSRKMYLEAEPLIRECLAIHEAKLPDDWMAFNDRSVLGASLLGQRKYAEAESFLTQGYDGLKAREVKIPMGLKSCLNEAARESCNSTMPGANPSPPSGRRRSDPRPSGGSRAGMAKPLRGWRTLRRVGDERRDSKKVGVGQPRFAH